MKQSFGTHPAGAYSKPWTRRIPVQPPAEFSDEPSDGPGSSGATCRNPQEDTMQPCSSSFARTSLCGLVLLASCQWAHAQLTAIVAVEPTARKAAHSILRSAMESGLSKAASQNAVVTTSEDLADVMRTTRSAGYDVFIGPAQVAASALQRGYELVGSTDKSEQYLLVGTPQVPSVGAMKDRRLYLPQQDSIYTYMARGMLNEAGLSFKDLKTVQHEKFPQAGLTAVMLGSADATVVRADESAEWSATHPRGATRQAGAVVRRREPAGGPGPRVSAPAGAGVSARGGAGPVHPVGPARSAAHHRQGSTEAARPGRGDRGHAHREGVQDPAHQGSTVGRLCGKKPQGCGVPCRTGRLHRPRQAHPGAPRQTGDFCLQRCRMLEIVQSRQSGRRQGLQNRVLAAWRSA